MRNRQSPFSEVLGVDVSKAKLDCAFADGQQTWKIDNTPQKIVAELIARIKDIPNTIVVMEATGGYEDLVVELLHQHEIAVAVVNPRRVRAFADGIGQDAKTDPIDAQVIAFEHLGAAPDDRRSLVYSPRALYATLVATRSTAATCRETQESRPDRRHAKAAHDPQSADQDQSALGGTQHRERLNTKTSAAPATGTWQ